MEPLAKRTRSAEEAVRADFDAYLDNDLWPALRQRLSSLLRERVETEVGRMREALEAEYQGRWAAAVAKEAGAEAAAKAAEEAKTTWEAEKEALTKEKDRMATGTSMDDIIRLNIGGEKMVAVQRRTLCVVEDSMLASSFSGRWDASLTRDEQGAVFVDFAPDLFMPLLDFLRARRTQEEDDKPVLMPLVHGHEDMFQAMLKYYGLESTGQSPPVPLAFTFVHPVEGRTFELRDGGRVAVRSTGSHWKRVFGSSTVSAAFLTAPVTVSFCVGAVGDWRACPTPCGPNLGFALASLERCSDDSNVRRKDGIWAYRAVDGALLAPNEDDIVGPSSRAAALPGDTIRLTLYRNGTVGIAKNKEDLGLAFRNLPDALKPVVEMNLRYTRVSIVS